MPKSSTTSSKSSKPQEVKPTASAPHTSRNIFIAFILNLAFSVYEFIGGSLTGSVAIVSDAVHDLGDALSIGLAYFLERKSRRHSDDRHTYGYIRYSLLGGLITATLLLAGSVLVIIGAIERFFQPIAINYQGMIWLAIIGVVVNFFAAYVTHGGHSLNQKSVNLHMLEDVLGWIVVLIGALVMNFTNWNFIDPLLSILVALFILRSAWQNCQQILDILLENTPADISLDQLQSKILALPSVTGVHHLHVWSIDGFHHFATLHVVTPDLSPAIKSAVRSLLKDQGISHVTLELEVPSEDCPERDCHPNYSTSAFRAHSHPHSHSHSHFHSHSH